MALMWSVWHLTTFPLVCKETVSVYE
jgi:hypothetical protein